MSARAPRIARCLNPLQLWRLWVGRDPLRAMLHIEQGLASALYVQTGLLGALLTAAMGAPAWASAGLLLASWLCALGFGWAVRSGWSQRFAEPMLLSVQAALMLLVGALHYLLLDRYRALVIGPVVLLLAFCMFRLERRSILRLVAWTLACFLLASGIGWCGWPLRFDGRSELLHLGTLLLCIPGIGLLGLQMSAVRQRLERERLRLQEALAEIERLATRDALTDLPNRRHAEQALDAALARLRRLGEPLALALVDLDRFKLVNDQHGHAVGDAVLRRLAELAGQTLRRTDLLARWGGEEFLLLMAGGEAPQGLERLQAAVRANEQPLPFRFSAGWTEARPEDTPESLLERADAALYRAKAAGRDRCERA